MSIRVGTPSVVSIFMCDRDLFSLFAILIRTEFSGRRSDFSSQLLEVCRLLLLFFSFHVFNIRIGTDLLKNQTSDLFRQSIHFFHKSPGLFYQCFIFGILRCFIL